MSLSQLLAGTFAALAAATAIGQVLRWRAPSGTVSNINLRIASWWMLCGSMALALWLGELAVLVLFAAYSMAALREFLALVPGPPAFWWMAPLVPLQYGLIWSRWPVAFEMVVPLAGLAILALRRADDRAYWGTILTVWCLSHAPAVLMVADTTLLFYLLLVVEASDVLQFVWGKLIGRTPLAPRLSPRKTWEGLIGGVVSATALGAALHGATPFGALRAAVLCGVTVLAGVAGGLTMSSIKRGAGVKDFGTILPGHGGVLDRIDSLCFAAPVFGYLVRYWPAG